MSCHLNIHVMELIAGARVRAIQSDSILLWMRRESRLTQPSSAGGMETVSIIRGAMQFVSNIYV